LRKTSVRFNFTKTTLATDFYLSTVAYNGVYWEHILFPFRIVSCHAILTPLQHHQLIPINVHLIKPIARFRIWIWQRETRGFGSAPDVAKIVDKTFLPACNMGQLEIIS
jgi:hypothetical protein